MWTIHRGAGCGAKTIIRHIPEAGWQEPQPGWGYELAEAVHRRHKSNGSFRLVIKGELRR
jgi:hypothetical protein